MTWTFEGDGYNLKNLDGPNRMTLTEFGRQSWPLCPAGCGERVTVRSINAGNLRDRDVYIPGRWSCPNGCTPPETDLDSVQGDVSAAHSVVSSGPVVQLGSQVAIRDPSPGM